MESTEKKNPYITYGQTALEEQSNTYFIFALDALKEENFFSISFFEFPAESLGGEIDVLVSKESDKNGLFHPQNFGIRDCPFN